MTPLIAVVVLALVLYYVPSLFGWFGLLVAVALIAAIDYARKATGR